MGSVPFFVLRFRVGSKVLSLDVDEFLEKNGKS